MTATSTSAAHIDAWRHSSSFNGKSPLTRAPFLPQQFPCIALTRLMEDWARQELDDDELATGPPCSNSCAANRDATEISGD